MNNKKPLDSLFNPGYRRNWLPKATDYPLVRRSEAAFFRIIIFMTKHRKLMNKMWQGLEHVGKQFSWPLTLENKDVKNYSNFKERSAQFHPTI